MKIMKYLLATAILAGCLSAVPMVSAAQKADRKANKAAQADNARGPLKQFDELNLTDDQKAKLKPLLQEEATKIKEIRKDTSVPRREQAQKIKGVRDEYAAKIKEILTPEQYQKWQQSLQDKRGGKRQKG